MIREKSKNKTLKVVYIKLGRGSKNQESYILKNQLYIGYGSNEEDIFNMLVNRSLNEEEFYKFIKENGDQNNLGPNALTTVYEDNGDTLWYTIVKDLFPG